MFVRQRQSNDNLKVEWRGSGERGHLRSRSCKTVGSLSPRFSTRRPRLNGKTEQGEEERGTGHAREERIHRHAKPNSLHRSQRLIRVLNNTQTVEDERKYTYTCLDDAKAKRKDPRRDVLTETFHSILAGNALSFVGIRFSLWEGGESWNDFINFVEYMLQNTYNIHIQYCDIILLNIINKYIVIL